MIRDRYRLAGQSSIPVKRWGDALIEFGLGSGIAIFFKFYVEIRGNFAIGDWMALSDDKIVAIIFRERNEILAYINSFLNDSHLSEDCFQELSSAALANRDSFEDETHVIRWSLRVARNKAVDFTRKRQRQPNSIPDDVLDLIEDQWVAELSARPSEKSCEFDYLEQCVEQLSPNARELVELRYFKGMGSSQVAETVGKKVETVYQALARAHIALRECVGRKMVAGKEEVYGS